jgi:glutathione synthase
MARILFIIDPLASLKAHKDSSVAMMRVAAQRGHDLWVAEPSQLRTRWPAAHGCELSVLATQIEVLAGPTASASQGEPWCQPLQQTRLIASDFRAVIMRKDPPYDVDYHVCTQLLERFEQAGVPVFNRPRALRDHGEKTAVLEFAEHAPAGLITTSLQDIRAFAEGYDRIVVKPLDAMGGSGIFVTHATDPNLPVIVETLTLHGVRQVMAQRWLAEIAQGDRRVLLIDGEPFPYCLARIPPVGASRGNLAAGGRGEARPLCEADRRIAGALGPVLKSRGLFLVGLDIIGDCLTEINITSPTGFQEIAQQTGHDPATAWINALESRL